MVVKDTKQTKQTNLIPVATLQKLKEIDLFGGLGDEVFNRVASSLQFNKVKKNDFIYNVGQETNKIYFLTEGTVKVAKYTAGHKELIKSILHPGTMFGEDAFLGMNERTDYAAVMNKGAVFYSMATESMRHYMNEYSVLSHKMIALLGRKLRMSQRRYESLVSQDARTRIIDFIKQNAQLSGKQVGMELLIKHTLTQQDIANFTATSRQTVTAVFNELRNANQIFFKQKSILIRDIESLA